MFFDIGVFATVVGATLLILTAIAHQTLRSPRAPVHRDPRVPAPGSTAEEP
jgi:multicomponent K+:H+ antiporter subunit A